VRALVTGGTGFLGRRLVGALLARGMAVRCLVRPGSEVGPLLGAAPGGNGLEIRRGTLGRIDADPTVASGCDVVFHLAAALSGPAAVLFMDNVVGTRKLIEVASRCGVRRFVLVSSLAVYGTEHLRAWDVLDESCPLDPQPHRRDAYTYSKVAQEEVAWEAHRAGRLPLAVVRPGVIYGAGRDCLTHRVGLRFGGLVVRMGGKQPLPYVHVDNCAEALALTGIVPDIEGESFNVVDDNPPTGRELLEQYRRAVRRVRVLPLRPFAVRALSRLNEWYHNRSGGQLPAVLTVYKSQATWKPLRYSNGKAKAVLKWSPRVGFTEGLEATFAWLRQPQPTASTEG